MNIEVNINKVTIKPVNGYEKSYIINTNGEIFSLDRIIIDSRGKSYSRKGVKLNFSHGVNGYFSCVFTKGGKRLSVHRLVYEHFVGDIPKGLCVNHIDANKLNNRLENLELVTYKENHRHARSLGLYPVLRGEKANRAKLTESKVRRIISLCKKGYTTVELAKMYSVSNHSISMIKLRRTWKHINV